MWRNIFRSRASKESNTLTDYRKLCRKNSNTFGVASNALGVPCGVPPMPSRPARCGGPCLPAFACARLVPACDKGLAVVSDVQRAGPPASPVGVAPPLVPVSGLVPLAFHFIAASLLSARARKRGRAGRPRVLLRRVSPSRGSAFAGLAPRLVCDKRAPPMPFPAPRVPEPMRSGASQAVALQALLPISSGSLRLRRNPLADRRVQRASVRTSPRRFAGAPFGPPTPAPACGPAVLGSITRHAARLHSFAAAVATGCSSQPCPFRPFRSIRFRLRAFGSQRRVVGPIPP